MDTAIQLIISILFGGGGIVGLLSMWQAHRAKKKGLPPTEEHASMPPWDLLAQHYQKELDSLRGDVHDEIDELRAKVIHLERLREVDLAYISQLETWIWQRKPPPPPARPPYPFPPYPLER